MDLNRVTFKCDDCGGALLETDDAPSNESAVNCKACGWSYGTFRDLKRDAVHNVLDSAMAEANWRLHRRYRNVHRLDFPSKTNVISLQKVRARI